MIIKKLENKEINPDDPLDIPYDQETQNNDLQNELNRGELIEFIQT